MDCSFWGLDLAYSRVPGVTDHWTGYTQGSDPSPTYESVCSGRSGHTEAVQVWLSWSVHVSRYTRGLTAAPLSDEPLHVGSACRVLLYKDCFLSCCDHLCPMQVHYDPKECSYESLLDCFFAHVDPTTKNRQVGHGRMECACWSGIVRASQ